jgi:hypothetical protein
VDVTDIPFVLRSASVRHKQDIDEFEDGCLNDLYFTFGYGTGCSLAIFADTCVDRQGRMKVTGVEFSADSQCPNFRDFIEGTYTGSQADVTGSWVTMRSPRIPDRNVATSSCFDDRFDITLTGRLVDLTFPSNTLTFGAGSTLVVSGIFRSTALDVPCPSTCFDPNSCVTDLNCSGGRYCYHGQCQTVRPYGPCTVGTPAHCSVTSACVYVVSGEGNACGEDCTNFSCPGAPSGTALPLCVPALPLDVCVLDCSGGRTCPAGMICSTTTTPPFCVWPP